MRKSYSKINRCGGDDCTIADEGPLSGSSTISNLSVTLSAITGHTSCFAKCYSFGRSKCYCRYYFKSLLEKCQQLLCSCVMSSAGSFRNYRCKRTKDYSMMRTTRLSISGCLLFFTKVGSPLRRFLFYFYILFIHVSNAAL
jgi:hypothetical protein